MTFRAVRLLVEEFGASALITKRPYVPHTRSERAKMRDAVRQDLDPPRFPSLIGTCPFAIVGDRNLTGRAERMLNGTLRHAGVASVDPAWVRVEGSWLTHLDAADVQYVLLVGADAAELWRKDVRVSKAQGVVGIWRGRWIVSPVVHPGALLRAYDPIDAHAWQHAVQGFVEMARDDQGMFSFGTRCLRCGDRMSVYDRDGLAWCQAHAPRGLDAAARGGAHPPSDHPVLEGLA